MSDINKITERLIEFSKEREWAQFHNAKDLALAISIEAAELNEAFLWKQPEDADVDKIKEELADVLSFAFLLAHKYGIDIEKIINDKIGQNAIKYPVEKAKGSAKKYNQL